MSSKARGTGAFVALAVSLLAACGDRILPAHLAVWRLSDAPVLRLSTEGTADSLLLAGVTGLRLLADGRLIVANSGAHELLVLAPDGRLQRHWGRKGQGPGEFLGDLTMFTVGHDSIGIWDAGALRWTVLGPGINSFHVTADPLGHPVWLHNGAIVTEAALRPAADWVRGVLDSLARVAPVVRTAQLDEVGHLWIRDNGRPTHWVIFAPPGRPASEIDLPAALTPLHLAAETVAGVERDSLDLESVVVYRLTSPLRTPLADSAPAAAVATPSLNEMGDFAPLLRDAVTAQEAYYSDHSTYSSDFDAIGMVWPTSTRHQILYATERAWAGVIWRPADGRMCGVAVGSPTPATWQEGVPVCGG